MHNRRLRQENIESVLACCRYYRGDQKRSRDGPDRFLGPVQCACHYPESKPNIGRAYGAGLNCTLAVISAVGVLGSAAAEVPSAGTSTFVMVIAWTGVVASGVQCVNAITRSYQALMNPESESLSRWDDSSIYSSSMLVVDALGVASALTSLPRSVTNL